MFLTDLINDPSEVVPFEYRKIKTTESEALINAYLQQASSQTNPLIIHMAGIPGAGKTTFYHSRPWPEHVFIAFDDIMENLNSYKKDRKILGNAAAFSKWELPARVIGYELLCRAVEKRKNIFFDNGGSSQAHLDLMQNIKKFGYNSEMYYIFCSLDTAINRAVQREKETNRYTPPEIIQERYIKILKNVKEYQKIVDKFYHVDVSLDNSIKQTA